MNIRHRNSSKTKLSASTVAASATTTTATSSNCSTGTSEGLCVGSTKGILLLPLTQNDCMPVSESHDAQNDNSHAHHGSYDCSNGNNALAHNHDFIKSVATIPIKVWIIVQNVRTSSWIRSWAKKVWVRRMVEVVLLGLVVYFVARKALKKLPPNRQLLLQINEYLGTYEDRGLMKKIDGIDTEIVPRDYPEFDILKQNHDTIKEEIQNFFEQYREELMLLRDLGPAFKKKAGEGMQYPDWRVLFINTGGIYQNEHHIPKTAELVRQIPNVKASFVSILNPHQYIQPHWGVFKGFARIHYPVFVPNNNRNLECYMRINSTVTESDPVRVEIRTDGENTVHLRNATKFYWHEGEAIMFDDTYLHDVKNNADTYRIVLLVDVVRKDMPWYFRIASHIGSYLAWRLDPQFQGIVKGAPFRPSSSSSTNNTNPIPPYSST